MKRNPKYKKEKYLKIGAIKIMLFSTILCHSQETATFFGLSNGGNGNSNIGEQSSVNLSTGTANSSITLATLTSQGYSLPIVLNYKASGIRVDQKEGWMGMGWDIFTGGSIQWNVIGFRDDFPTLTPETGIFNNNGGYFNTKRNGSFTFEDEENILQTKLDVQPDEFYFKTPRHSGMFVYKKTGFISNGNTLTPVLIPDQDIKVERTGDYFSGNSFKLTDDYGYKYTYNTAQSVHSELRVFDGIISENYSLGKAADYETEKFIDKIEDYNNKVLFTFEYKNTKIVSDIAESTRAENRRIGGGIDVKVIRSLYYTDLTIKRLSKIYHDGGYVIFNEFEPTNFNLKEINFYNLENLLVQKITFEYEHIYEGYRNLKKIIVSDANGNTLNPYVFDYVSANRTNREDQDHWGFYNAADNSTTIPANGINTSGILTANREPNSDFTQFCSLNKITYPTGGSKKFYYENNDYSRNHINQETVADFAIASGIRIKKIITDDGDNDHTNDICQYYKYKLYDPNLLELNRSSGYLLNYPKYDSYQFADCLSCNGNNNIDQDRYITDSQAQNQSQISKAGIVSYRYITEYNCDLDVDPNCYQSIGYSVSRFLDALPYNTGNITGYLVPNNSFDYSYKRGLLQKKYTYKGDGTLLNKIENLYGLIEKDVAEGYKTITTKIFIDANAKTIAGHDPSSQFTTNHLYSYKSTWVKPVGSIITDYVNGIALVTTKTINYNTIHKYPVAIITDLPDGSATKQTMKYVQDYATSDVPISGSDQEAVNNLKNRNVLSISLYTTSEFKSVGDIYKCSEASFLKYKIFDNTNVLLKEEYTLQANKPALVTTPYTFHDNFEVYVPLKLESKINSYYTLNNATLPKVIEDENGLKKSIIYKGKLNLPIAEISFQENDYAYYTSYEFAIESNESTPHSILNSPSNSAPYQAVTGERYLRINNNSNYKYQINVLQIPIGEYIVSYWSDQLPIFTGDFITINNTRNDPVETSGWRYNEYTIKVNSPSYIYIGGSPLAIDELRIYPKNATMNSTCYNASGQVVSTCDINNNIVHTQYDSFNRIKATLDRNRNIIKTYNYSQGEN